jgi:CHC2-type zinc finger protein
MARRPIDYRRLRDLVSPLDVLHLTNCYSGKRERAGYRGPCPVHRSSSSTSRSLSVQGPLWHCHRCRRGGDALELWCLVRGVDHLTGAYQLCEQLRIDPPYLCNR